MAPQLGVRVDFSQFRSAVARFIFSELKFEMRETTRALTGLDFGFPIAKRPASPPFMMLGEADAPGVVWRGAELFEPEFSGLGELFDLLSAADHFIFSQRRRQQIRITRSPHGDHTFNFIVIRNI